MALGGAKVERPYVEPALGGRIFSRPFAVAQRQEDFPRSGTSTDSETMTLTLPFPSELVPGLQISQIKLAGDPNSSPSLAKVCFLAIDDGLLEIIISRSFWKEDGEADQTWTRKGE
jgi:hypothetical protein